MLTDSLSLDITPEPPAVTFSYAHPGQSLFRRGLIHGVEFLSGQPKLRRLYVDWMLCDKRPGEPVFDAALRLLEVRPRIKGAEQLAAVPREGGLLLVANHPFGVVDGLTIGHLGMRLRGNVRILN